MSDPFVVDGDLDIKTEVIDRLTRRAGIAAQVESVIGRHPTKTELDWLADGWIPGSLL